jgi:hypothetical protein
MFQQVQVDISRDFGCQPIAFFIKKHPPEIQIDPVFLDAIGVA